MGFKHRELLFGGAPQKLGRVPARDEIEAEAPEHRLEGARVPRKLVPELHALEPRLPRLRKAGLQRGRPAERAQIVVRPPDRVRADADAPPPPPPGEGGRGRSPSRVGGVKSELAAG